MADTCRQLCCSSKTNSQLKGAEVWQNDTLAKKWNSLLLQSQLCELKLKRSQSGLVIAIDAFDASALHRTFLMTKLAFTCLWPVERERKWKCCRGSATAKSVEWCVSVTRRLWVAAIWPPQKNSTPAHTVTAVVDWSPQRTVALSQFAFFSQCCLT